jgi:hypothetical protein
MLRQLQRALKKQMKRQPSLRGILKQTQNVNIFCLRISLERDGRNYICKLCKELSIGQYLTMREWLLAGLD